MTADEAIKKASKYFEEGGVESPGSNALFSQAMLFMMEELIRVISSRSSSPSATLSLEIEQISPEKLKSLKSQIEQEVINIIKRHLA
jgi:hypothetical protein